MFFTRAGVQNSYNHKVRIGNWSEEQELDELKMKEYLYRKANGDLLVHKVQKHLAASLQEVGLTYSKDGFVHIGDHVMLYSVATEGVLSVDPSDKAMSSSKAFAVTTSTLTHAHVARNTFVIEPYGANAKHGEILKFGQHFRIRINPKLSAQPVYLHSQPVSSLCSSKSSRYQEVCFSPSFPSTTPSYDTVWKVVAKDISTRFELEGQNVSGNTEILILHAATQQALSSDLINYYNDFGLEYEVCAHTHVNIGKTQGLYAELQGKITTDIPVRREHLPNFWAILTASLPEMDPQVRGGGGGGGGDNNNQTSGSGYTVLEKVRDSVFKRGMSAVHNLSRTFRLLDTRHMDSLSMTDFEKALRANNISLSRAEIDSLASLFDSHQANQVDYSGLMKQLRGGDLNERRLKFVHKIFDTLQVDGRLKLKDAALVYEPANEPLVKNGTMTADDALRELLSAFEGYSPDGTISKAEFTDYYSTISAFMQSDDYFVHVLSSVWRVKES